MQKQIPRGPKGMKCPQWRKPMSQVCHTCAWWVEGRSKRPGGPETVEWQCAIPAIALMTSVTAQCVREAGAETEALRNELVRSNENTAAAAATYQAIVDRREHRDMKLIEARP